MLVCPLQGLGGIQGKECFLRVTSAHLFEVELRAARTLERLELQSLVAAEMESETESPREWVPEVSCGVGGLGRGVCVPGAGLGTFHFPCEYLEPRSALGVLHVAGEWTKGWILRKGLVSAPALWGQSYCFPLCSVSSPAHCCVLSS